MKSLLRRGFRALGRDPLGSDTSLSHTDSPTGKTVWEEWKDVPHSITIELAPGPFEYGENAKHMSWMAGVLLATKDLPRLMRETTANIHPDMSLFDFEPELDKESRKEGWTMSRTYFISDLGKDRNWAGFITVLAREVEVLSKFRVSDLRPHMITCAVASNNTYGPEFRHRKSKGADRSASLQGELAYFYDSSHPSDNMNAIYDDMPLEGWWPWPKRVSGEEKDGAAEKTETETELRGTAGRPFKPQPRGAMHCIRTFCSDLRCW